VWGNNRGGSVSRSKNGDDSGTNISASLGDGNSYAGEDFYFIVYIIGCRDKKDSDPDYFTIPDPPDPKKAKEKETEEPVSKAGESKAALLAADVPQETKKIISALAEINPILESLKSIYFKFNDATVYATVKWEDGTVHDNEETIRSWIKAIPKIRDIIKKHDAPLNLATESFGCQIGTKKVNWIFGGARSEATNGALDNHQKGIADGIQPKSGGECTVVTRELEKQEQNRRSVLGVGITSESGETTVLAKCGP
jgi:hypothetical protein